MTEKSEKLKVANIWYEDRRQTRKDGWQFWLTKIKGGWIKLAGARRNPSGEEIYELYCRQNVEGFWHDAPELEFPRDEFIKRFKEAFGVGDPFQLPQTENSNKKRAPIDQVGPEFFVGPYEGLWRNTPKLYRMLTSAQS